jgi:hypothetical protein
VPTSSFAAFSIGIGEHLEKESLEMVVTAYVAWEAGLSLLIYK